MASPKGRRNPERRAQPTSEALAVPVAVPGPSPGEGKKKRKAAAPGRRAAAKAEVLPLPWLELSFRRPRTWEEYMRQRKLRQRCYNAAKRRHLAPVLEEVTIQLPVEQVVGEGRKRCPHGISMETVGHYEDPWFFTRILPD